MQSYENFSVCTRHALDYTDAYYRAGLSDEQKRVLLELYRILPAFDDVHPGLVQLRQTGASLYAFSNGSDEAVETLLANAGIQEYFIDIISVDEIRSFKPDPAVYRHFLKRTGAAENEAWLVSSNPFDVLGAISVHMKAAWIQRTTEAIFDPWGIDPTVTVSTLDELANKIVAE
jgi:2-haloacid dehalogenase